MDLDRLTRICAALTALAQETPQTPDELIGVLTDAHCDLRCWDQEEAGMLKRHMAEPEP